MTIESRQPVIGKLVYRERDYAFDTEPRPESSGSSLTVNELELILDDTRTRVLFVTGYCPHMGWCRAKLGAPVGRPGVLRVPEIMAPPGGAVTLDPGDRWPVLADEQSGWIRVGRGRLGPPEEGVRFAPGAVAVITDGHLVALWLQPQGFPKIP